MASFLISMGAISPGTHLTEASDNELAESDADAVGGVEQYLLQGPG
jgi:hypothetical protein